MKKPILTFLAITCFASSLAAMDAAEFFARDRENNWTGKLRYERAAPAPKYRERALPANRAAIRNIVIAEAKRQGVPQNFAVALVRQESGFNPRARSPVGAMGVMQIMPGTWRAQGCTGNPWEPQANVRCGMGYLAKAYRQGGPRWAALRYHGGPNTRMHGRKTQAYARNVLRMAGIRDTAPQRVAQPQFIRVAWAGDLR